MAEQQFFHMQLHPDRPNEDIALYAKRGLEQTHAIGLDFNEVGERIIKQNRF
jgi:hypothetical protein